MGRVTILHISDVHWSPSNDRDLRIVVDAMLQDLQHLHSDLGVSIDLLACTGDLVQAGENDSHFQLAHQAVIKPILDQLDLSEDRYLICPGNHDISRANVRSSDFYESGLQSKLTSNEAVNSLIDRVKVDDPGTRDVLSRMANYERYVEGLAARPSERTGFMSTYRLELNGISLGIACLNNSWRASGEAEDRDRGRLLLGERSIDDAIAALDDATLRIAMFHHPVTWLSDFDAGAVSPRIARGFDLALFGHVHTVEPELRGTISGTSILSQSGSLYAGRRWYNGYQVIQIDTEVCEVDFTMRTYFDAPRRRFGVAENISRGGQAKFSYSPKLAAHSPDLERFLRQLRPTIRSRALEHYNIADLSVGMRADPHAVFICPPLVVDERIDDQEDDENTTSESSPLEIDRKRERRVTLRS